MEENKLVLEIHLDSEETFKLFDLKCPNCNRIFEVTNKTIMHFCPCGYTSEIKFEVVD